MKSSCVEFAGVYLSHSVSLVLFRVCKTRWWRGSSWMATGRRLHWSWAAARVASTARRVESLANILVQGEEQSLLGRDALADGRVIAYLRTNAMDQGHKTSQRHRRRRLAQTPSPRRMPIHPFSDILAHRGLKKSPFIVWPMVYHSNSPSAIHDETQKP